eukprot:g730.t1
MWTWHFFHKLLRCPWHDGGGKDTVSSHPSNKCNCPMCKNGYHLRKKIGEGGFGAVYTSSKDDLAIKITSNCDLNDSIMEYKVLMQVAGHTHILQPIDFYLHHGAPVLVTELIHGGDLASRVGNGAEFSTDELARIAEQMLSALAHVHGKGFIHRDVKSDNILCVSKSFFKLADFGLCCASSRKDKTMQVGTTFLMAPEVQRGNGCYGRKVDSFSLGATLVELGIATFLTSKFSSSRDEMLLLLKQQRPEIGMAFQNLVRDLTAFSERRRSDAATALQTVDALF